jgi:hypothetical protein
MTRDLSPDAKRLAAIRRRMAFTGAGAWDMAFEGADRAIVSADGAVLFRATALATGADHELAAAAKADIAFLIGLVDRAAAAVRESEAALHAFRSANPLPGETAGSNKNYAAESAIKLQNLEFRQFLRWHPDAAPVGGASGDRHPEDTAIDRLRAILGIQSRRELNMDPAAAQRWLELRAEWDRYRAMPDAVRAAEYPGYGSSMREPPAGETPLKGGAENPENGL